ncbi:bifunctional rhamnulose-1-phosphate aldolase/short-chain dehydrogenase [Armatimonas sp.]|uniref:bifunctional rhamnulose-1-phosphate aldolase/short-chain dehydrogenase n=1 Tax=Armatimonas sp. TaxID=1872638 RepID=UPI00286BDBC0|nr:bifunctional rhamnulose-1-phosphate aldolase/short-chain dehydrogenase [Armatimonas sp.]
MTLTLLSDLWDDSFAATLDEPELLRYRSNLLGSDPRLTNFGGGNTSAKVPMPDPVTGEAATVLWVKGSGGDLGTIQRDGFATLYQDKLEALKTRYRGEEFEDEIVDLYPLCVFGTNPRAASIDTPLHAFLPFRHVDHLHPDWAIALAASANGPELLEQLRAETGLHLVWLPWKRPGFELGLWLEKAIAENPNCDGIILGSHGIFTWGDDAKSSYQSTLRVLDLIGQFVLKHINEETLFGGQVIETRTDRRELTRFVLPALRGRNLVHFSDSDAVLRFVNSADAAALAEKGTSCPDHFVRTKVKPLLVSWDAKNGTAIELLDAIRLALPSYRADYAAYYEQNKEPSSPALRSAEPSVVLIPGVGMLSFGKNKQEARITGEFYTNAIHVMEGATSLAPPLLGAGGAVDNYLSLSPREAFRIEYWLLEEAKLKRMPPEKELARQVAVVVGTGSGIGRAVVNRLVKDGAVVVCADINLSLAQETAAPHGESAIAVECNITDRASVRAAMDAAVLAYGGIDTLIAVAAVIFSPDDTGRITEAQWRTTFDVNTLGSYLAADEAMMVMREQASGGQVVLISSANGVVAKQGSFAYDASKAALNHLVRELAVAGGPNGIRVNAISPASVVSGSHQFPRDRVLTSLAKYGITFDESEETEALREKLAGFYAQRTLLKKRVTPEAVAEAVFLLASPTRLPLTTGQSLPVDAGLTEAFLR